MSVSHQLPIMDVFRGKQLPFSSRAVQHRCIEAFPGSSKLTLSYNTTRRAARSVRLAAGDFRTVFRKDWVLPEQLLPCDPSSVDIQEHRATVYTVRLSTALSRKAALCSPGAGVQLCLIGKDARAVLYRVSPDNNFERNGRDLAKICAVVQQSADQSVGINCSLISAAAASPLAASQLHAKPRFQEGSVDEVSFLAPDLGPLAGLLVAPEAGSWTLDEINVVSSRTGHADRFVLRKALGEGAYDGAAYLSPIPQGAVVYGSGDGARILTKVEADALQKSNMDSYEAMKQRLMATTAVLTAGGTCLVAAAAGSETAIPFVVGGAAGMFYSWLLQNRVDGIEVLHADSVEHSGAGDSASPFPHSSVMADVLRGSSYRGAFLAAAGMVALWSVMGTAGSVPSEVDTWPPLPPPQAWQILCGTLGFFTYKLAFLTVALTAKDTEPAHTLQALEKLK